MLTPKDIARLLETYCPLRAAAFGPRTKDLRYALQLYVLSDAVSLSALQVYAELTSRSVMTMEWVEGARLTDRRALDAYGLEPSKLVDTMVRINKIYYG